MGTSDYVFVFHGLIAHLVIQEKMFCALVGFKNVFDFVNRDIIWATTRENVPSDKILTFNETSFI